MESLIPIVEIMSGISPRGNADSIFKVNVVFTVPKMEAIFKATGFFCIMKLLINKYGGFKNGVILDRIPM